MDEVFGNVDFEFFFELVTRIVTFLEKRSKQENLPVNLFGAVRLYFFVSPSIIDSLVGIPLEETKGGTHPKENISVQGHERCLLQTCHTGGLHIFCDGKTC